MIKDPWNPQESEIRKWAYSNEKWPEQDWDLAVCEGSHDDTIYDLAHDKGCPKRGFFVHSLYFMIGDPIQCENESRQKQLFMWLNTLPESKNEEINTWKKEANNVLKKNMKFVYDYWCDPALNRMVNTK